MWTAFLLTTILFVGATTAAKAGCTWSAAAPKLGITGFNNVYEAGKTVDQCKAQCEVETRFVCRSFDYYSHWLWGTGCYLSDVDTYDIAITTWTDYTYYELVCEDDPRSRKHCPFVGPIAGLGISGNNIMELNNVTPEQCMDRCKSETSFHCKSFDYEVNIKKCFLQVVDRDNVALTTWSTYAYYELTCETQGCSGGTWQGPVVNMGISGNNLKSVKSASVEQCKAACQNELAFKCRSFDYYTPTNLCYLQSVTSTDVALTSWTNYNYYDLSGCNGNAVTTIRTLSCYCIGDPHCYSFDGIRADFMGTCKYTLARDNCANGLPNGKPSWEVVINSNRNYPTETVSRVREVTIILDDQDLIIDLFSGLRVQVNGAPVLGFPSSTHEDVTIIKTFTSVYVTVKGGIQVTWDGSTRVQVSAPDAMKTKMCGLCGDANGNSNNDWTIGDSDLCMDAFPNANPGSTTNNVNEFGYSWTQAIDDDEASCKNSCPNPPNPESCPAIQEQKAEAHCKSLTDPTGPFKECLAQIGEAQKKDLFDNCVYDSCHLNDFETVICDHAASMAKICQGAYEVSVTWRSNSLCPMECGEGMEYKACGNICLPTCSDPEGNKCGDTDGCEEGCFCKEGMVFDGVGTCYSDDKCGCKVPDQGNVYINVGVSYMSEDCSEHCACEEAEGDLVCTDNACTANKVCGLKEGVRACYCEAPFVMDGSQCITLVSPCETIEESQLQCFSCSGSTEAACDASASMQTCSEPDAICQTVIVTTKTGDQTSVKKGCISRATCSHASLGRDGQDCSDSTSGSSCVKCNYGEQDKDFVCKVADPVNVCGLLVDEGAGTQSLTRYFYKAAKGKCVEFTFKGQDGNGNNFTTMKKCEAACKTANVPEECLLEADPGTGSKFSKKFYFDAKKNKCKKFNYSGEGGNGNNFNKKKDCSKKCK